MSRRFLWLAAALVALVACEKSPVEPVVPETEPENATPWILKNLFDEAVPADGAPLTIGADFGGTRAHIDMNAEGTYAQSVWKAGDKVRMFGFKPATHNYQYSDMTTSQDGATVEFSTPAGINSSYSGPFTVIYPATDKIAMYNGQVVLGVNIPTEQVAVPGGIMDGYTVAVATSQSKEDFLHFQNKVSLVRFRMSGSVVSQVKSVTIKGTSPLAGDAYLYIGSDGGATWVYGVDIGDSVSSTTVTLSGDFVAGQDYFLVLKSGEQSGFKMVFADGQGNSTTKVGSAFAFPESRISDFGTIDLGESFGDDNYDPIKYMEATAGAQKPVTIAVIGDGFTKDQQSDFEMLAKAGIDALMNTEPYKSYSNYFNVWILKAVSRESGASVTDGEGNVTTPVDNYFGSKWGESSYGDMDANSTTVFDFVSENCPDIKDKTHSINEVPILIIINDSRYGGICHSYSNGQGYGMVPWTGQGMRLNWTYPNVTSSTDDPLPTPVTNEVMNANYHYTTAEEMAEMKSNSGDWRNTLVHEFGGHCFGRLSDEYWPKNSLSYQGGSISSQTWTVPMGLNLAADPLAAPWKADLLDYPLETLVQSDPNYGRIGVFQGGGNKMFGRWRSEKISCMIDNRFYFSTWQRMLIVRRIMKLSGSSFSVASFWDHDVTTDPVRDTDASYVMGDITLPVRIMPPLPEPVLHEVD
jgi:hypothetical protein